VTLTTPSSDEVNNVWSYASVARVRLGGIRRHRFVFESVEQVHIVHVGLSRGKLYTCVTYTVS
jgi:hypothetical protein